MICGSGGGSERRRCGSRATAEAVQLGRKKNGDLLVCGQLINMAGLNLMLRLCRIRFTSTLIIKAFDVGCQTAEVGVHLPEMFL